MEQILFRIRFLARLAPQFALALALMLTAIPAVAQEGTPVRVDKVISEPLSQTVPVIGRLVARQAGVVAARINGPVMEFQVEVGDRVSQNQIIALLDPVNLAARRDMAAGKLGEVTADLATSKAELALASQELRRLEKLKKSAAFSQARFDDARQRVAIANAKVRRSSAAIASAEADLRLVEINLRDVEIRAPYDGVITERLTETGSYVQIGAPLVRMMADRTLEIEADVPFQRLRGLSTGATLDVTLDDGSRHRAQVRAIIPAENPLTRTRAVRLTPLFNGFLAPLADAQSVTVAVPVGEERQILSVHKDAIVKSRGETIVFVVVEDTAERRAVVTGEAVGGRLEVLQGLTEGDRVVVRGNERLQPGAKVTVSGDSS